MNDTELIVLVVYLLVNLVAFLLMWIDKIKSTKQGSERISEGLLFFIAAAFGSLGIYAGMFAFRHKTRKWYFLLGVPLLVLENLAVVYLVNEFFMSLI
jgi:uncharacterized membrane protein YsdA (DUF1294 family)